MLNIFACLVYLSGHIYVVIVSVNYGGLTSSFGFSLGLIHCLASLFKRLFNGFFGLIGSFLHLVGSLFQFFFSFLSGILYALLHISGSILY